MKHLLKKILITLVSVLFILLLFLCIYQHYTIKSLINQAQRWQVERYYLIERINSFESFLKKLKTQSSSHITNIPSIWPTEGKISSLFGTRVHPISRRKKFHTGVDIANLTSTDIIATADGVVDFSGRKGGYGNAVILSHGNGFKTLYGHAKSLLVSNGDKVTRGMVIAKMGSTGRSTGPHLHYEILFGGEHLDPVVFVE